jgi:polyisoprenoid-binding protein YceI
MIRNLVSRLAIATSLVAFAAWAEQPPRPFKVTPASTVSFEATGPAGLSIQGATKVMLSDEGEKLTFVVPTTELKTGIGLRDDHLRKHIRAKEHPAAKLEVLRSKLTLPSGPEKVSGKIQGNLTFHGVTRPVQVSYAIQKADGDRYKATAEFELVLTSFGLEEPCYLGVCVRKNVRVKADLTVSAG